MMHKRVVVWLAAVSAAVLLSGCSGMAVTGSAEVDRTAFGAKKKFAVVSIASLKTFNGEKGMSQWFKDTDEIPGANTQPLINAMQPKILAAMKRDKNFTLIDEKTVLRSKAYKTLAEDERKFKVMFMSDEINVAANYKYVTDATKLAQLARELKVDGVIGIMMNFTVASSKSGVSVNGLSLGKKSYSPMASVTAMAYNGEGKLIWKDSTVKEAEPGDTKAVILLDTTDMTKTNFEKLHPAAIEIGTKAVDVLLARFDDTMAGKEVSSVQSFK